MDKEYKNIDCENCAYQFNCHVMYSYNNAACLTIRKPIDAELKETMERYFRCEDCGLITMSKHFFCPRCSGWMEEMEDEIPKSELVRVVRCKNCIHSEPNEITGGCICRVDNSSRDDLFFCATGKRKNH